MTRPAFAELLRRHRDACGMSQAQQAERAGLNEETVRELERGEKRPRRSTVTLLADALALSEGQRQAFREAAAGGAAGGAGGLLRPRGGLRRGADSFVGREQDVAAVRSRLEAHRLVTLTGPGGVGKTRLAVEVAHGLASTAAYPGGVWLAELAPLADPGLIPQAVAAAVGVELEPGGLPEEAPTEAVAGALRAKRLLLVLDNCEHLVDACAALAEALLEACPGVRLLATSREPLGCAGEAVVRVPSLAVPPAGGAVAREEIAGAAAVRLFVDRAEAVAPGFALTAEVAPAVDEVCRRQDGIPLALEFAARLVRGLSVETIAARLDDRFRLLAGGRRTALGRQQTLRALVDWSYDLLSPAERTLFVRLSAFVGPFTLDAAESVGGASASPDVAPSWTPAGARPREGDVLTPLLRLVDTSFVLAGGDVVAGVERPPGPPRYRLLETLREYGRERLVEDPAGAQDVRDRHLAYHLGLLEAAASAPPDQTAPRA
jgi:predicted ATPase/DNA-binding XRE family transcriptional regulator